jgi:glycosyltransferase involved in cell wall biosynthesis
VLGRSAGGIARHVADIVAALDGRDGLTMDIAGPLDLPVTMPKQLREVTIPDGPIGGHRSAIRALRALVSTYDVVHAHGLRAGIDAGIATRDPARSLVTVHNLVRPEIAGWKTVLYRRAEALAVVTNDHVFAVSEDIARRLRTAAPRHADDVEVLYLGLAAAPVVHQDREAVRTGLGVGRDSGLVVTAARLAPQKALHVLLAAVEKVPDVIVAILGEGPLRTALEVDARRRGISDRVRFLGFLEDAHDYIAAGDVFCLSSAWEGVPLAAQEAIRVRVPVVATDVGGMRELISNKLSGRLVPPGDPDALARALRETLASPDDRERFTRRALEDLEARFSSERMLQRLSEAYAH